MHNYEKNIKWMKNTRSDKYILRKILHEYKTYQKAIQNVKENSKY